MPDTVAPATIKLAIGNALVAVKTGDVAVERLLCEHEDGGTVLSWPVLAAHLPETH